MSSPTLRRNVTRLSCIFLIFQAPCLIMGQIVETHPTVTLPEPDGGTLVGVTIPYSEPQFLNLSKSVDAYLGVPFAEPPVGNLRFSYPIPKTVQGEYNATYDRAECFQWTPVGDLPNVGPVLGRKVGEDCLYLSIYTPSPKPSPLVPVFVWIHGGGYVIGGGSEMIYEPLSMVTLSDIIVVLVNYRLGVLGYLTTGDDVAKGNYGMMDQVMALQWVQDNIEAFGGDPGRVTIGGESAGGSSVSLLSLSPLTQGLFHQSIMQSGNALCPWSWTTMELGTSSGREFAESFGCPTGDSSAMIACLRQLPGKNLTYASFRAATPVVDGFFLPDTPASMVDRRLFKVHPTLMGTNEDEGASNALSFFPDYIRSEEPPVMNISFFRSVFPRALYHDASDIELASIEQQYVDWSVADNETGDQLDAYIRISTDTSFACPTEYMARALDAAGAEVYRYEMTHDPSWSIYVGIPKWLGASHAEDLQYVFTWGLNPAAIAELLVDQTDEEKAMSVQFVRYWTNFIISGNPNGPLDTGDYPEWPRYTMPDQEYKKLSLTMTNGRAMRAADCAYWMKYNPSLRIQTDPIEDVYEDWQDHYDRWKTTDMPSWMSEFEEYKENNVCPSAIP